MKKKADVDAILKAKTERMQRFKRRIKKIQKQNTGSDDEFLGEIGAIVDLENVQNMKQDEFDSMHKMV